MSKEFYSKNLIKLGDGKPAAEYVTCITADAINQDWNSEVSILRKHMTLAEKNGPEFFGNAARILGWWTSEMHFTLHFNQFALPELNSDLLTLKPDHLGHSISLNSNSQSGGKLWLVKSYIQPRLPLGNTHSHPGTSSIRMI
jgi:hypothetical protein